MEDSLMKNMWRKDEKKVLYWNDNDVDYGKAIWKDRRFNPHY